MTDPAPDDFELLQRWRAGDPGAGDALVRRHYGAVLRFFEVRTRLAEDLTQRTFLACVEGRERFRGDASFRAYLFGIARNQLFRHLEDERRVDRLASLDEPEPQPGTSLSVLVARREEHQLLLTALSGLPEEVQTVIVLHYWEFKNPGDPNPATWRAFGSNSTGSHGVRRWLGVLPNAPACAPGLPRLGAVGAAFSAPRRNAPQGPHERR